MNLQAIIALDQTLSKNLRLQPEKRWLWNVTAFLAHSGDSWFWLAALFVVWLFTFNRQAWHIKTALMATGILVLAVLVLAVGYLLNKSWTFSSSRSVPPTAAGDSAAPVAADSGASGPGRSE